MFPNLSISTTWNRNILKFFQIDMWIVPFWVTSQSWRSFGDNLLTWLYARCDIISEYIDIFPNWHVTCPFLDKIQVVKQFGEQSQCITSDILLYMLLTMSRFMSYIFMSRKFTFKQMRFNMWSLPKKTHSQGAKKRRKCLDWETFTTNRNKKTEYANYFLA